MTESLSTDLLAVDGGGTRCRVACSIDGVVRSVETGPANVSTDFDGGVQQIKVGLEQLSKQIEQPIPGMLRWPAFVGLAGVTGNSVAERLRKALGLAHAWIEDDRPAAVRGALGSDDGLIAHCGTGSFLAIQKGCQMRFAGGWGPILGDEASAQWVGRRILAEVLLAADRVRPKSNLTDTLSDQFGGVAGIVKFAREASPDQFGAIAPQVTAAAATGDKVAQDVMKTGADYIADMATRLGWHPGLKLCLTGGIAPHFADFLPAGMRSAIHTPLGEPLDGALALAKEIANEHS